MRNELDSLKKELNSKKEDTLHAQRMEEDMRLMRKDLNRILEERSVAKQSAQDERASQKNDQEVGPQEEKETYGHMSRKKTKKTYSSKTSSRSIRRTKWNSNSEYKSWKKRVLATRRYTNGQNDTPARVVIISTRSPRGSVALILTDTTST